MKGMNGKKAWYVLIVICAGTLALGGCPKKAEISTVPETQREEKPVTAAIVQPEQKGEEANAETQNTNEQAAAARTGLQPVFFDFNKAFIATEAGETMRANAEWLKAHPQVKVRIEGNCDERGTIEYNQALGQRRAANAKKYLTDMGIAGQRIVLISYGKEKAICADSTEGCWQQNRRDDFTVVTD